MEDRHGPVTGYSVPNHNGPSAAAAGPPPPNCYYNYQPNPYYHQQYYQVSQPDSVQRSSCLRCIFAFVIGLFLIFGTATFIVWLVLRPQLPEFQVDSFSLSNFTFTNGSRVFLISEIHLTARNPNSKMSLSYDHVETAVYYKLELLSKTALSPFSQETKNETSLVAKFAGDGSFVEKPVVDGINGEIGKNANVGFDLRLFSWINFESKSWMSRNILKVFCGNLVVGIPSNGRPGGLTDGPRPCRVGI
ncbi:NDR1/HIN1-like protein 26 [Primulina huaijiensis]|uniref:NDR1/HIN1-like protein 26 n=1 Tax=Primulina huaijiensis TaxID=1492673 RepID=UPI003CC720C6